ncbi:IS30 family transposase [Oceanobacillus sp. FSL K6-0251]|uniref:IS30 family transposase n=1 Tax=Oceanobacillus sp. FSL K6-0251 TaxID=2921602 RepID=UPI0030FB8565
MTHSHSNTEKRNYTHLTEIERGQIAAYREQGMSLREIGEKIGCDHSTISRELKRGTVEQIDTNRKPYKKYFPDAGARVYEENRRNCGAPTILMASWEFILFAEEKILKDNWSPDVVVGHAKKRDGFDSVPCSKTLYNWIDNSDLKVKNMDLVLKLRRKTKSSKSKSNKKILGTSIEERPESIDTREEFGHWEIDTVLGHKSKDQALLTLVERKTRMAIVQRIPGKNAPEVRDALEGIFQEYPNVQQTFKSITADNGSEFSELSEQGKEMEIDVYFAHPYASWERGTNERHNGLLRRFIKKGQPIHAYSDQHIAEVANWMNTSPRKILNYETPEENFAQFVDCVA